MADKEVFFHSLVSCLCDTSDAVAVEAIACLALIAQSDQTRQSRTAWSAQYMHVMEAIIGLFSTNLALLSTRGALVVRKLAQVLPDDIPLTSMAHILVHLPPTSDNLMLAKTMAHTFNMILLTAPEFQRARQALIQVSIECKSCAISQGYLNCTPF
jgi:hypothetical protein